jgi:ABC-type Zn uptake system ZnuABC Zn-binding protein ZnuA
MKRFLLALAVLFTAVSTGSAQDRLRVVTTTSDLRSLVKAVGAERVIVSNLVPAGDRVEEYQPRLQDVGILKDAKLVIRAGPGIDPWFDKLLARSAQKNGPTGIERGEPGHMDASLVAAANDPLLVSAGFARTRRASRGGGPNPHYWLDPKSAEPITKAMVDAFSKLDPAGKPYFESNRQAFLSRLNSKIEEWQSRLRPLQGVPMVALHDDWEYFANRFRLDIVDTLAARDRAPPKRAKMAEIEKLIRDGKVKLIITEANEPERHANRLAKRTGVKTVELTGTVGGLPNTDDYIAMFDANVNALTAAIEKK